MFTGNYDIFGGLGAAAALIVIPLILYYGMRKMNYRFIVYVAAQIIILGLWWSGYSSQKEFAKDVPQTKLSPEGERTFAVLDFVAGMNKRCPVKIDSLTRLDSADYELMGKQLNSYYTLLVDKQQIESRIDWLKEYQSKEMLTALKRNSNLDTLKNMGVTFGYTYRDVNGKYLLSIRIKPEEYQNTKPQL